MAIDPDDVRRFWEARAARDRHDAGLTNLEEDPALRAVKLALEDARVVDFLPTGGAGGPSRVSSIDSRLVLHVWLDRAKGNLAVARHRMQSLTTDLVVT